MNKTIFRLLAMAMIAMLSFPMMSCSDDDEEPSGVSNPLLSEGNLLLTDICYYDRWGDRDDCLCFQYDNKFRPYGCYEDDYDDELFTIDYNKGKICLLGDNDGPSISFNSKGYITKIQGSWSFEEYDEEYSASADMSYSYDKDDHLLESYAKIVESGEDYSYKVFKTTFTWNGGNLTSIKEIRTYYYEDCESTYETTRDFTYGNQENPYKQIPATMGYHDDTPFFMVGLLGVGPEMLPETEIENDKYVQNATFTLNEDGSIDTEKWINPSSTSVPGYYKFEYASTDSYIPSKIRPNYVRPVQTRATVNDKVKRVKAFIKCLPFVSDDKSEFSRD